jgi:membrane protein DedA with SNARE-associated domain
MPLALRQAPNWVISLEQWIVDFANNHGPLIYLVILVWTFLEGETVVLITGAAISGGAVHLSVWLLALFAFLGSFGGDQAWFYIGRTYGTPLLKRWPTMASKVEFAFTLLRRQETLFILAFRFIYGLRNISPFIIGMTGVPRTKFIVLNLIAAAVWANTFAWGGYSLGKVLETYLGESSQVVLATLVVIILCITAINWFRQRRKNQAANSAALAKAKMDNDR